MSYSMFDYVNPVSWASWMYYGAEESNGALGRNAPTEESKELKSAVGGAELFNARVNLRSVVNSPQELVVARENLKKVKEQLLKKFEQVNSVNDPENWEEGSVNRELLERYGERW